MTPTTPGSRPSFSAWTAATDYELWFSDGSSGTVTVTDVDGALDVQWDATGLLLSGGATVETTESGHMRCTPE